MSTKKTPTVSIILPAYNAEKYLKYAVDSMLDQTYDDFELIIINDGSSDSTKQLIDQYAKQDERIIPIHQKNIGLVATLNKAAGITRGKYIARMDADDISLPRRLETQVKLLDETPDAVLCASCFDVINEHNEFVRLSVAPAHSDDLKRSMHLYNPIAHGSVMYKKDAFLQAGGYSNSVGPTEDYDLWIRLARLGSFVYSERSIFRWRMNPEGITHSDNGTMQIAARKLVERYRKEDPVAPLKAKEMIKVGNSYTSEYGAIGVIMKEVVLEDNYNLGIKALKEKRTIDGVKFILSVALTGRTGLGIVINRTVTYTIKRLVQS